MTISATFNKTLEEMSGMRKTIFLLISLVMCLSCATMSKEERLQKASAHYQLGKSYLNNNNIQPAFVEFQKALELDPNHKESHNALGILYLQKLENYPSAIEHFQEALDIDKNFSEAENNLANAYAKTGQFDKAIAAYTRAVSNPLYKNAALALNNLAMLYYRLSKYDKALDTFKEALKRFSEFALPYYGLALCYNALGQYGDAAMAITHAIEYDQAYRGDREKAREDLNERRLTATGEELKDVNDYLDILRY
jgi:tetratricopeptide (TPR) repeat protein